NTPTAGATSTAPEEETTPATTAPTTPTPSSSPTTAPPPQSVTVTLAGARTEYSGTCPPPNDQAPAFTATFTVGRLPAEVDYRWVTKDGEVESWKTLSFPEGGEKTKQDQVIVTTYADSGTHQNEISVEVRDPVRTTSDAVAFSVTCVTETPTGGASPSPTPTP
ncbi:serine/threonine protein kinase, partial [Streptomyces sp. PSKA30]|nr:serine/threonine protein kinase [Streptomyces sp. PSKA30]